MKKIIFSLLFFYFLVFNQSNAENIIDLRGSTWKINDTGKIEYAFFNNGRCSWTVRRFGIPETKKNCVWSQNGKKVTININGGYFVGQGVISGTNINGSYKSGSRSGTLSGYATSYTNVFASKPKTQPKKQPKKEVPKISPDDNKIVAASSGTGFFVSRTGHIITNHHVVDGCDSTKLTYNGKEITADVLAIDKMNDLAILKADIKPFKVYSVSKDDPTLLQDIIIAGFPLGKKVSAAIKTSKGSVTALAGYGDNYSEFQTDAALNQGNSGGPIMSQKGNVVGVAVANYGKKQGVESFNFGIKSSTLNTFANSNGLKFLPPNNRDLSNKDLGQLITEATIYLECYMTVAEIKKMIAQEGSKKAFFSKFK